jgi:hypothetical protein
MNVHTKKITTLSVSLLSASALLATTPALAATPPTVTQLVAHGPNGVQSPGTTLTYTATANGHGSPVDYQFWEEFPGGWSIVQNWSPRNTFTIAHAASGSYPVVVNALTSQQIHAGDWSQTQHQTFIANVGSQVSLSTPSSTVATNTTVTLNALASHLINPVYQFWYETPSGQWVGSNYTSSNTFTFKATTSGTYHAIVYAKDPIAPDTAEFSVWSPVSSLTVTAASGTPTPSPTPSSTTPTSETPGTWQTVNVPSSIDTAAMQLSSTGQTLAVMGLKGQVALINLATHHVQNLGTAPGYQTKWNNGSFQIGWGSHGTLYVINQFSVDRYVNGQWQQNFGSNAPWTVPGEAVNGPNPKHFLSTSTRLDVWTGSDGLWQWNGTTWQPLAGNNNPYPQWTKTQYLTQPVVQRPASYAYYESFSESSEFNSLRRHSFVSTENGTLYSQYVPQSIIQSDYNSSNPLPFTQVEYSRGQFTILPHIPHNISNAPGPLMINPQTQQLTTIVSQSSSIPSQSQWPNEKPAYIATFSQGQWSETPAPLNQPIMGEAITSRGTVIVYGKNSVVYAWQHGQWTPLGNPLLTSNQTLTVQSDNLTTGPHGTIFAVAGIGSHIYEWVPQS